MDINVLTTTLTNIVVAFDRGVDYLHPTIQWLLFILMGIELIFLGLRFAADESGSRSLDVILKLLFIMFWGWFTLNFNELAKAFVMSLERAGEIAGGGTAPCGIMHPSCIIGYGLTATAKLELLLKDMEMTIVDGVAMALGKLGIILAYLVMGIQVALAVVEFYLYLVIAGLFMPFGVMKHTKFLAEKGIGAIVGSGVKLMILTFMLAVIEPLLTTMSFTGAGNEVTTNEVYAFLASAWFMAFLVWSVPNKAVGYLSGSPNLSAGGMAQSAVGTASAGISGVSGSARTIAGAKNLGSAAFVKTKSAAYSAATLGAAAAGKLRGK